MFDTFSAELFLRAATPSLLLIASGAACFVWQKNITVIPATVFSLGVTLLFVLLLISSMYYSYEIQTIITDSLVVFFGLPLLVYLVMLVALVRRAHIALWKAVLCGFVGLFPLYWIGGFVVISTACSFSSAGC